MPPPIEPGDRKLLIVAAAILMLMTAASWMIAPPPSESPFGVPTSYSPSSSGSKAAYLLLEELGYEVESWEKPLTALPDRPEATVLILAEPHVPVSENERHALRRFIRAGGHVLAAGSLAAILFLPEGDLGGEREARLEWKSYRALAPSPLTRGAAEITLAAQSSWSRRHPAHLALYGDENISVGVTYRFGRGRVVWLAAATPLTNAGIRESGNLQFFLNALGARVSARVLWDEFYHGYSGSLWSYLGSTPVPWAAAQLGLGFLAVLATFARRHSPLRPPVRESRLNPLEFVETLGALYHRARAFPAAVGVADQRFRFLLTRQLGLPPSASAEQLQRAARDRLGWKEVPLRETIERCEQAERRARLEETQALRLVQALHDFTELLRAGRPREKR